MAKKEIRIITVYGNEEKQVDKVAFYEKDEAHPDGEAYVVNDGLPVEVAETQAVKRALGEGKLTTEKVSWASKINPPKKAKAEPEFVSSAFSQSSTSALVGNGESNLPLRKGGRPGG